MALISVSSQLVRLVWLERENTSLSGSLDPSILTATLKVGFGVILNIIKIPFWVVGWRFPAIL